MDEWYRDLLSVKSRMLSKVVNSLVVLIGVIVKSKITIIPNFKENPKQKVRNHMAKLKAKTHQTNG